MEIGKACRSNSPTSTCLSHQVQKPVRCNLWPSLIRSSFSRWMSLALRPATRAASIVHQPLFPGETVWNLQDVSTFMKFSHFTCDFSVWSLLYHSSRDDQWHFSAYKCLQYILLIANCKLRLIQSGKEYTVQLLSFLAALFLPWLSSFCNTHVLQNFHCTNPVFMFCPETRHLPVSNLKGKGNGNRNSMRNTGKAGKMLALLAANVNYTPTKKHKQQNSSRSGHV